MNTPSPDDSALQVARISRVGEAVKETSADEPRSGIWTSSTPRDAEERRERPLPPLRFKTTSATA
jgi:hypothetical protein